MKWYKGKARNQRTGFRVSSANRLMGSGWGSVGRAVASELEVSGSNPVIGKIFAECLLSTA